MKEAPKALVSWLKKGFVSVTTLSKKCSIMALSKCNNEGDLIWKKKMIILIVMIILFVSCLIDCVGKLKCIKNKCDTEGEQGSFCSAHAQCR